MPSKTSRVLHLLSFVCALLIHLLAEVTSKSYYHSDLVLDFLCTSRTIPVFVRDVPWDCTSYVVCVRGRAIHSQCPGGKLFGGPGLGQKCLSSALVDSSRCRGQMFNHIQQLCQANPTARIPSPDSCSHYFDCTASTSPGRTQADHKGGPQFVEYLMECPYPQLFSPARGQCQHHSYVTCRGKFEPKAPCEYLQYLQMYNCVGYDCGDCNLHHPSCLGLRDGFHPVPMRSDVIMKCQRERTVDILSCPPGYGFSKGSPECVRT